MKPHPCAHRGHLWVEVVSGQPFVRHRGRSGFVPVHCQNCDATNTLQSHSSHTAGHGTPPMPIDDIPLAFQKVIERAMIADRARNKGPARTP